MSNGVGFIELSDDLKNNTRTLTKKSNPFRPFDSSLVYFESSNIIVKVEGKNPNISALLLSAHYDSVPTSHGATDDGKGIACMLALLDYYSNNRPDRTIIFNFNNNEEFGLLGAKAFLEHKWFHLVKYFLNLEGTGIGSRAVLFRTTNTFTANIYKQAVKKLPFGNSIYQQGFNSRLVSSETDYIVYEQAGLIGWDIAFYKPRNYYHTIRDSVSYTSRAALWHMLNTSWQLSRHMIESPSIDHQSNNKNGGNPAVFFDILGLYFHVMDARSFFAMCCVMLALGPISLIIAMVLTRKKYFCNIKHCFTHTMIGVSLLLSSCFMGLTVNYLESFNPFFVSRNYLVLVIFSALEFLIINYAILTAYTRWTISNDLKVAIFFDVFIILWATLVFVVIKMKKTEYLMTGVYPLFIVYFTFWVGALTSVLFERNTIDESKMYHRSDHENNSSISYSEDLNTSNHGQQSNTDNSGNLETTCSRDNVRSEEYDERAPLVSLSSNRKRDSGIKRENHGIQDTNYEWIFQFLLTVPVTTLALFESLNIIMEGMNQTVQESRNSQITVIRILTIGSIAITLPSLPFVHKVNCKLIGIWMIVCASAFLLAITKSPFTSNSPLKVRFLQDINLHNGNSSVVRITGIHGGFVNSLISDLPSVKTEHKKITCEDLPDGLQECNYEGTFPRLFDTDAPQYNNSEILSIEVMRNDRGSQTRSPYEPIYAELLIKTKENRACTVSFRGESKQSPVRGIRIFDDLSCNSTWIDHVDREPLSLLQLHKLDFDRDYYRIGITWFPKLLTEVHKENQFVAIDENSLSVFVNCYWGEYDSVSTFQGIPHRKMPAFDEILAFAPLNFTITNREKGLVVARDQVTL